MKTLQNAEKIIQKAVNDGLIPSAEYAFVSNDLDEYGYYGFKELVPNKKENDQDTLYDMASCSKVVATTTMILKLIEEGLLKLDTKITDILFDYPHKDITIKMCLTHTTGYQGDDKSYKACKTLKEMQEYVMSYPLINKPLEKVEYSDFNYIILGFVIEKLKGNIEEYANEVIFKPLNMNDTMYNPYLKGRKEECACTELTQDRGLIQGVVHDGKAFHLNGLSGNAGVFSNVKDLSKFVKAILNDGYPILKKETVDELKKCYTEGYSLHRTLGWCVACDEYSCGTRYSNCAIYHTGFTGTSIYIDFERQCGIILLTNRIHPARHDVKVISGIRNQFHDTVLEAFDNK